MSPTKLISLYENILNGIDRTDALSVALAEDIERRIAHIKNVSQ